MASNVTRSVTMATRSSPDNYLKQGFSPLHSQILAMFDHLKNDHHNVWFDNLYLSAKFCKGAYNHTRKVKISGPTRKAGRGLPSCDLQQEVTKKEDLRNVRGTVKAAVLDGDEEMSGLVAVLYYDQKPVHFLSTICKSVKWIKLERKVYCNESQTMIPMSFLRLNINNEYNKGMGEVDVADQLCNYYRFNHWL